MKEYKLKFIDSCFANSLEEAKEIFKKGYIDDEEFDLRELIIKMSEISIVEQKGDEWEKE